jgi:NAD(P) transhydrogenase
MSAEPHADRRFDVIVLGCGPAGERAAIHAARAGKSVAVVERAHVLGGTRINWGTIPSKTLRESALFVDALTRHKLHGIRCEVADEITVADFMYRERVVVQHELELVNAALDRYRIEVFHGRGRFLDPHRVVVERDDEVVASLAGEVIVIATGSTPNHPRDVPFDGDRTFDSDTILGLPRMPRTMLILGAGVIGVEYASIFAALGISVTLVDTRDRLLPYLDRELVAVLEQQMSERGVTLVHDDRYDSVSRVPGRPGRVRCRTRGGAELEADVLLYCVGRDGNTHELGLATLDIVPDSYGLLEVNDDFQTRHPHVYAVGDVIGYPALASTSMEQGRRAIRHAFALPGPQGKTDQLPFAIYSIPEVSYVGASEETLRSQALDYVSGRGRYSLNPRGQILGDTQGLLKLLFAVEDGRLLGVHIVGSCASELVHIGQAFLRMGATAEDIADTIYNYPTLADLFRHAALEALHALHRRTQT